MSAHQSTHGSTGFSASFGGDSTGVDHHNIRIFSGNCRFAAGFFEGTEKRGGFVLVDLAAQGVDNDFFIQIISPLPITRSLS